MVVTPSGINFDPMTGTMAHFFEKKHDCACAIEFPAPKMDQRPGTSLTLLKRKPIDRVDDLSTEKVKPSTRYYWK